jgi:hypothetical protein
MAAKPEAEISRLRFFLLLKEVGVEFDWPIFSDRERERGEESLCKVAWVVWVVDGLKLWTVTESSKSAMHRTVVLTEKAMFMVVMVVIK